MAKAKASDVGEDIHEGRINRVLAVAYERENRQGAKALPMALEEVLDGRAPNDGDEVPTIRRETACRLLTFLFQNGPHPGAVVRLVYLLAWRTMPELVLNMNGSELAEMMGETRAAWSARNKKMFTDYLRKKGFKATLCHGMKSESACTKYAAAAMRNTNRRGR
jgi:hypothetical protein